MSGYPQFDSTLTPHHHPWSLNRAGSQQSNTCQRTILFIGEYAGSMTSSITLDSMSVHNVLVHAASLRPSAIHTPSDLVSGQCYGLDLSANFC